MSLGPAEIMVILLVALLVFGPNRLPEVGRQVGKGMREIRKFQNTLKTDLDEALSEHPEPESPAPTTSAPMLAPLDAAGNAAAPDDHDPPAPPSSSTA